MALPINVNDLIHQRKVERTRIEYKENWTPEPIIHTITAFANDFDNMGGGYILIGAAEENGRPRLPLEGLDPDSIDDIQRDLLNKCNFIEPRCIPVIEPYNIDGKDILVLWVPGGEDRPYKCPEKVYTQKGGEKSSKAYYIRKGARTLKANAREERELIAMARDIPFDDRINYHADITDMKPALLADYLHTVGSDLYDNALNRSVEAVATDMQLVRGPSEYRKPVNVGLMFFSEHPEQYFSFAQIEVVDKPDPTGIGMTEKTFKGPLDRQLRDALAYIRNYIIKEYVTKVPDSELAIRAFNWPYQAVEEALSNAVYHKSYQIHEPITVTVTPEKMEILSLPGPDRSITDEHLADRVLVSRRYRNRRNERYCGFQNRKPFLSEKVSGKQWLAYCVNIILLSLKKEPESCWRFIIMNGTSVVKIPKFMEGEALPEGYYDAPNPYANPPAALYNVRAMVNYALEHGKTVTDLTKEEAKQFLLKSEDEQAG